MYSVESIRNASVLTSRKYSNGKISLKLIEKRLKHLREELKNFKRRDIAYETKNLLTEQQINENGEYYEQYKSRLNQLLRLYDKQVSNLHLLHLYRYNLTEKMYENELHQARQAFLKKKNDFKTKLISTLNDKRRYLQNECQSTNIRCQHFTNIDQTIFNGVENTNDDTRFEEPNQFIQQHQQIQQAQQQQQQRPMYNLRRTLFTDLMIETPSATASLEDLSIFSRNNSVLPPFVGIELQQSLSNGDIEQDIINIQHNVNHVQSMDTSESRKIHNNDSIIKPTIDVRIEDGRLWYQRAWFSRNTAILLVFDDLEIVPALILTIGRNDLLIRRSGTNIKHRISLSLLYDGHLTIRKRNSNV